MQNNSETKSNSNSDADDDFTLWNSKLENAIMDIGLHAQALRHKYIWVASRASSRYDILVTLGIGFPKENKKYWESHYEDAYNPMTYIKENIEVNYID